MKKIYFSVFGIIVILIAVSVYYYSQTFKQQLNFQEDFLLKQTKLCGYEIEQTGFEFSSDISQFFENEKVKTRTIQHIESKATGLLEILL